MFGGEPAFLMRAGLWTRLGEPREPKVRPEVAAEVIRGMPGRTVEAPRTPPLLLSQYPSRDLQARSCHRRLGDDTLPTPVALLEPTVRSSSSTDACSRVVRSLGKCADQSRGPGHDLSVHLRR